MDIISTDWVGHFPVTLIIYFPDWKSRHAQMAKAGLALCARLRVGCPGLPCAEAPNWCA